jgi:hypothetical protein
MGVKMPGPGLGRKDSMSKFKTPKVITVDISNKSVSMLLQRARQLAQKEKITIAGNDQEGTVKGKDIDGDYHILGGALIRVTLREAPSAPWFLVKMMIIKFINGKG